MLCIILKLDTTATRWYDLKYDFIEEDKEMLQDVCTPHFFPLIAEMVTEIRFIVFVLAECKSSFFKQTPTATITNWGVKRQNP